MSNDANLNKGIGDINLLNLAIIYTCISFIHLYLLVPYCQNLKVLKLKKSSRFYFYLHANHFSLSYLSNYVHFIRITVRSICSSNKSTTLISALTQRRFTDVEDQLLIMTISIMLKYRPLENCMKWSCLTQSLYCTHRQL